MEHILDNPVYNALMSGDSHLGFGEGKARSFYEEVSPFAGFEDGYPAGFDELYEILPRGRYILFATPAHIEIPVKWKLIQKVEGVQMLLQKAVDKDFSNIHIDVLTTTQVIEMIELTKLTNPGPFASRTIEFGNYYGIFVKEKLIAMAGQRMHIENYTEISAVCTHPDHLGKGYATALVQHQVKLILQHQQTPFLHVRADNDTAIRVYERLGFIVRRPMNFYFIKKRNLDN